LDDNNTQITCIATQLDHNGKDVLYESSANIILRVEKIVPPPTEDALTQKIGIISGVLLTIIFLLLAIAFLMLFICKRKRKRSGPSSSQVTDDTLTEPHHSSVIKPIWTTNRGMTTSPIQTAKVYKEKDLEYQNSANSEDHHNLLSGGKHYSKPTLSHTVSGGTMSTQSTGSQGSWEEDRSGNQIKSFIEFSLYDS